MTIILGCDPGTAKATPGGLALVDPAGPRLIDAIDLPIIDFHDGPGVAVDGDCIRLWLKTASLEWNKLGLVVIEKQGGRGRREKAEAHNSQARLFACYGSALTALYPLCRIIRTPHPSSWQAAAGLVGRPKSAHLDLARRLFGGHPRFKHARDHGRADAALIALFGMTGEDRIRMMETAS